MSSSSSQLPTIAVMTFTPKSQLPKRTAHHIFSFTLLYLRRHIYVPVRPHRLHFHLVTLPIILPHAAETHGPTLFSKGLVPSTPMEHIRRRSPARHHASEGTTQDGCMCAQCLVYTCYSRNHDSQQITTHCWPIKNVLALIHKDDSAVLLWKVPLQSYTTRTYDIS